MLTQSEPVLLISWSKINRKPKDEQHLVAWTNLNVVVTGINQRKRVILSNIKGKVKKGDILAILGPSGAGKTTLLDCLSRRRKPNSGQISYNGCGSLAYVPQKVYFLEYLTIYESLMFASTFKNEQPNSIHAHIVDNYVKKFQLEKCKDTQVWMCSGGERKRLSIALEAISEPDLLVLDEPTTGLDSFTATKCLETLRNMCKNGANRTTIIATIHQPNSQLLNLFDRIYLLSDGSCLYDGSSMGIHQHLTMCKFPSRNFSNPMDVMVKIAAGQEGPKAVQMLREKYSTQEREFEKFTTQPLALKECTQPHYFAVKIHIMRFTTEFYRRKLEALLLLLVYAFPPIVAIMLFTSFEQLSGCFYIIQENGRTLVETPEAQWQRRRNDERLVFYIYFTNSVCFLAAVGHGALLFPHYVKAFKKEYGNQWYTLASFFVGFGVVSFVLHGICATVSSVCLIHSIPLHLSTSEKLSFISLFVLTACISNLLAMLVSILFYNHQLIVLMIVVAIGFIQQLLSTFLIKFKYMESLLQILSNFSAIRFIMESIIVLIFPSTSCSVQNTTTLTFSQVIDLVRYYRVKVNTNIQPIANIPLKTFEAYNNQSWTPQQITEFLKKFNDQNEVSGLEEFWNSRMNYILDAYDMNNVDITANYFKIISMFAVGLVTCYVCLLIRFVKLRH